MHELFNIAYRGDNRLILVGDIKQHHSVGAGDALRALERYGSLEVTSLRTIHRQINPAYRKAVQFLARSKAYQAFEQFENLAAVKEIADPARLFEKAASDYVATILKGKSCLAISPVWSEIHQFTDVVILVLTFTSHLFFCGTTSNSGNSAGALDERTSTSSRDLSLAENDSRHSSHHHVGWLARRNLHRTGFVAARLPRARNRTDTYIVVICSILVQV